MKTKEQTTEKDKDQKRKLKSTIKEYKDNKAQNKAKFQKETTIQTTI